MSRAKPQYLRTGGRTSFAVFHPPDAGTAGGDAVLICSPWGWDEVASYRSRKRWAEALAAAGHPALRLDLPGTGQSEGSPLDADLLGAWADAIVGAVAWLEQDAGAGGVAVLGLGLGGLLAREAIGRGAAVRDLVLWAAPADGRSFVRETKAFARLQSGRGDGLADSAGQLEGGVEAGGFVLSAETREALEGLRPDDSRSASLRRALLLDRDGVPAAKGLREGLEGAGVDLTLAAGAGWGAMVSHPERSRLPRETVDVVGRWLAEGDSTSVEGDSSKAPPATESVVLRLGDAEVRETIWAPELSFGRAFGVFSEPASGSSDGPTAVFLNAGAVRNTGPNRMWVEACRRWAARGISTLRVDLEGIGEADGDETRFSDVAEFYVPQFQREASAVLELLAGERGDRHFVLAGLCSGGYWSFRTALGDPRVDSAILLNAGALAWHRDLLSERDARKFSRVLERRSWVKLFRGGFEPGALKALVRALFSAIGRFMRRPLRGAREAKVATRGSIESDLDGLTRSGTQVAIAFSGGEPLDAELRAAGIPARRERWPNLRLESLPGADHTLRPLPAQRAAHALLDRELGRALDRAAALQPDGRQR